MFHIANKVYLEYDFRFHQQYPYIVASERWATHPLLVSKAECHFDANSFDGMLEERFEGDVEKFWEFVTTHEDKLIIFVDPDTHHKLQMQYWKSVFASTPSNTDLHLLYTSWIEHARLLSFFDGVGSWDVQGTKWSDCESELKVPTKTKTNSLAGTVEASATLQSLDKTKLSFEYLLCDYLAGNDTHKTNLLARIKTIAQDNWMDEIEHLRYELICGGYDLSLIDPSMSLTTEDSIEKKLAASSLLAWVVDSSITNNPEAALTKYDISVFNNCLTKLGEVKGVSFADIIATNNLIAAEDWEGLLEADVASGFGCSYTKDRFLTKCNNVFATFCYSKKRSGAEADLASFAL